MLIGIDTNQANKDIKSGVEWYTYHLIENLKKISQDEKYKHIRFRLYSSRPLTGELAKLPANFESRVLKWLPNVTWNLWTQVRLSIELKLQPPDIFLAPGYTLSLLHPKKSAVVIHDLGFKHFPDYYPKLIGQYYKFITWYSIKTAWQVLVPSNYTKQDIIKQYDYPADRIFVTHLSYDKNLYFPVNNKDLIISTLERFNIKKPYLLFIARLTRKKNILGVIKAFHQIKKLGKYPDLQLVLGGQKQIGWNEAEKYITKNNLDDDIKILGYVPEVDKSVLMSAAEAFLFPSFFEGFGIPVLEAMACGTPVVTANTTSLPEVAGEAALLVNPFNIDNIAQAIEKILTDKDLSQSLSQKGIVRVQEFSWKKTANKTLNILIT